MVLNVARYQRLNQVLGMLQEAREAQLMLRSSGGGAGGRASSQEGGAGERLADLKEHIKQALEEAVRLRADNESLRTRAGTKVRLAQALAVVSGQKPFYTQPIKPCTASQSRVLAPILQEGGMQEAVS